MSGGGAGLKEGEDAEEAFKHQAKGETLLKVIHWLFLNDLCL